MDVEFILRLDNKPKMGVIRKADKGDLDAQYEILTSAMCDVDGNKMSKEEATEILDNLEPEQYQKTFHNCVKLVFDIPLS